MSVRELPTVVLVPSLGTTVSLFDGFADELERRIPGVRVLRSDLPGHGLGPRAGAVSIADLANKVVDGIGPAVVAGVSMGGAIALEAARLHPEQVVGFVQINSGVRFGSAEGWKDLIDTVAQAGTGSLADSSAQGWFAAGFRESPVARELVADLDGLDDDTYIACCRALAEYDGMYDLRDIDVPALLIGTADDLGTPSSAMRELAENLPRAEFVELPAGGHLSIAEHAVGVAGLVADWASRHLVRP